MGGVQIVTRFAERSELQAAAGVLGDAFADYPWTRWTVDRSDHERRIVALQHLALEHFGLPYGAVSVTTVDGEIRSVAAWTDSAALQSAVIDPEVATTTAALEGDRHEASLAAEEQVAPLRPDSPHLYLGTVGTAAAWQRTGLASRTLALLLETADHRSLDVRLETSSWENVAFYHRLGFSTEAELTINSGGPPVWIMVRRPR